MDGKGDMAAQQQLQGTNPADWMANLSAADKVYFDGYSQLYIHKVMLQDKVRMVQACSAVVKA